MKKQLSIRTMTSVAVLSAVAFVLAFFEFPVPLAKDGESYKSVA
jgi:riboflavin transporter FmnP